jgi:hypothetical protein
MKQWWDASRREHHVVTRKVNSGDGYNELKEARPVPRSRDLISCGFYTLLLRSPERSKNKWIDTIPPELFVAVLLR